MSNQANFGWISSWYCQTTIDRASNIQRFHSTIGLLSLALSHTTEIEAQSYHPPLSQFAGHLQEQWIAHITAGRLWMTKDNYRYLCLLRGRRDMSNTFKNERRLSSAWKFDRSFGG